MNCVICKGDFIEGLVNHIVDINNHIIIIKNVPALICSQCGDYFIDDKVARVLESLIDSVLESITEISILNYSAVA